jgi:hypothetical protein
MEIKLLGHEVGHSLPYRCVELYLYSSIRLRGLNKHRDFTFTTVEIDVRVSRSHTSLALTNHVNLATCQLTLYW